MPYKILVVEDELGIRKALRIKLSKQGYDVTEAEDGQEAIDIIESGTHFDLVLSDIMMPRVDGEELVKWLSSRDPIPPVIVLTALTDINTAVGLMKSGAYDYLVKPVNYDALFMAVENAIKYKEIVEENKRLEEENRRYQVGLETMVREQTQTIRLMLEYAGSLNRLIELDDIIGYMLEYVNRSTGSENAAILLIDEEEGDFKLSGALGAAGRMGRETAISLEDDFARQVLEGRELVVLEELSRDAMSGEVFALAETLGAPQVWSPIAGPQYELGIVIASGKDGEEPYTEEDRKILSYISDAGAVSIRNAGLYHETQVRAITERNIRHIFQKYVPKDVVQELIQKGEEGLMGLGESKEVSLLNLDLRGYSHLAQEVDAETVVKILNLFFNVMGEVVFKYNGIVDKYLGDGFLALFGAPVSHGNDASNAILAAIEMRERMKEVSDYSMEVCGKPLSLGIAINTGKVIVGNIGFDKKMEYTVIGEAVNTAFRIEALTHGHPDTVLISKSSYDLVADMVEVDSWGEVEINQDTRVTVYEVLDRRREG